MEKYYQKMLNYIHQRPRLKKIIIDICDYFPYIPFCMYPCLLFFLFLNQNPLFMMTIIKPLSAFLIVTLFRKIVNRPRPYVAMNIKPLLTHKQGESFPSRHTVSAFIIALMFTHVNVYLGIMTLIVAMIISGSRILAGVHYISDVVVSILIAIMIDMI